jgi:putative membrane protein
MGCDRVRGCSDSCVQHSDRTERYGDATVATADSEQLDNTTVGTAGQSSTARQFADKAMMANKAEIKLGQLAIERTQNSDVKQFAQMMVNDHTKALNELKQAAKGSASEPEQLDAEHQQLYDRLSKLNGAGFDREYMTAMVNGHRKVRDMVEDRADGAPSTTGTSGRAADAQVDMAVTQWAKKALPTVEHHLKAAQDLNSRLK